jgi:hypothetical protein
VVQKPARVGLWDRYGGSMPSGWTRYLLERFEFPFEVVFVPTLDRGDLNQKFDVLIFVDGAIPPRTGGTGRGGGGDQPPPAGDNAGDENTPAEYRGRRGSITAARTLPQLRKFLEGGGTILTIGSSTGLAQQLGLPVANHLADKGAGGQERPLTREKFYVPGSLLRTNVNAKHPLAWGLPDEVDVMFQSSPVFRLPDATAVAASGSSGETATGEASIERVAWFESKSPLRSGWIWGEQYLSGGTAIADARVGQGRLVLLGPEVLFRAQPHGTFKFVFNGIFRAGEQKTAEQK